MNKKLIYLLIGSILLTVTLGITRPARAYILRCFDPDDGPMVCYPDPTAKQYCLEVLIENAPIGSNPVSFWDPKTETCYHRHDLIGCYPNFNVIGGLYRLYYSTGPFMDEYGRRYVWYNSISGCAALTDPENGGFRAPAIVHVEGNYGNGTAEIRTGTFDFEYGTCGGMCKISTTKMTQPAIRALELLPYRVYKKAFITILNGAGELAQGTFRLCYDHPYNEDKNPAYFRYNGIDWTYYGGFWNLSQTKYCMYSEISGNYVLVELGQN